MTTLTIRHKVAPPGSVKADQAGRFKAYPSTFTRVPDSYGDVIHRNAFDATLQRWRESGNTIPGLFGHRMDDPQMFVAGADDYGTDATGWWVEGKFDLDTDMGAQVHKLVLSKRLTQLSFAFTTQAEGQVTLDDGTKANELRAVDVHEFSFVPLGANPTTFVESVKTTRDLRQVATADLELRLRLARVR
jgi:HK97 family phage prohead protease